MGGSQSVPEGTPAVNVPAWSGASASSSVGLGASGVAASQAGNSLTVDRASFQEQFLTCLICTESFDAKERCPKRLPCHHTFCLACLTMIHDQAEAADNRIVTRTKNLACPTCREKVPLSKQNVKTLPTDHRVVQMLDFFSQADAQAKLQTASVVSETRPAASGSQGTKESCKETRNHTMTDMDYVLFDVIQNTCSNILGEAKASSLTLTQSLTGLGELQLQLHLRIRDTFTEYQDMLKQREQFLCREVTRLVNDRKNIIRERMERASEHTEWLQQLHNEITSVRQDGDIRKLWDLTDQMKQRQTAFKQESAADASALSQCCHFVAQNEGAFFSDLSDLGKIEAETAAVAQNNSASCVGIGLQVFDEVRGQTDRRVETDQHQNVQDFRSIFQGLGAEDSESHRTQSITDDEYFNDWQDRLDTYLRSRSEQAGSLGRNNLGVLLPSDNSSDRGTTPTPPFPSFVSGQSAQNLSCGDPLGASSLVDITDHQMNDLFQQSSQSDGSPSVFEDHLRSAAIASYMYK